MELYDQRHIQSWYNEYGEQETLRWNKSIVEKVKFYIHHYHLDQHINEGDRILELGAGTGVFTRELAKYASDIVVTDLSPVQLELNKRNAEREAYAKRIKTWNIADICDLKDYQSQSFDKVVCYGGPLSYVFEKKTLALSEIKRVLKPNGVALLSVMNLWGTVREYLNKIILPIPQKENEKVIKTGNLHPSSFAPSDHYCHMFRSDEFKRDLEKAGFEILTLSASNCLSALRADELEELQKDEEKWKYFLSLEVRACRSPGMLESGTHLIAVVKSRT